MRLVVLFHVTRMVEKKNSYRVLVGKPDGKRSFWRHGYVWKDNIKSDPNDRILEELDCTRLTQGWYSWPAMVKTVMNRQVSQNKGNLLTRWGTNSFSKSAPFHGVRFISLSSKRSLPRSIPYQNSARNGFIAYPCYMSSSSKPSLLHYPNNIMWPVQVFSPATLKFGTIREFSASYGTPY